MNGCAGGCLTFECHGCSLSLPLRCRLHLPLCSPSPSVACNVLCICAGKIGEHQVMLNNLMPWVQAVALGHRPVLNVYGTDYDTRDGTCVRDYIHVTDLGGWHSQPMPACWRLSC